MSDAAHDLNERAKTRFGAERAAELAEDIAKLADELTAIEHYPISLDERSECEHGSATIKR